MIGKWWFCLLLTAAVLFCGCREETETDRVETEAAEAAAQTTRIKTQTAKVEKKMVKIQTNMGEIVIELNEQAAPVTVKNFLGYVEEGFYDGAIFHRVISGFMIQGGGFTKEMVKKETRAPIVNEAKNGLKNSRGTIAMARTSDPDSATAQFFINHKDNGPLDYVENVNPGYAVFGKTIEGMDVVDAIASVQTTSTMGMKDVPVEPVVIESATVVSE